MARPGRGATSADTVRRARDLRGAETSAERLLWGALRDRRLGGLKFRRQHPYAHLILDFFCVEKLCAVELDGGVHDDPAQRGYDEARSAFLAEHGIRVIRIHNEDVLYRLPDTLQRLLALIADEPPLS